MKKRIVSIVLVLALCLSLLPAAVLAEDVMPEAGPVEAGFAPEGSADPRAEDVEPVLKKELSGQDILVTEENKAALFTVEDEDRPAGSGTAGEPYQISTAAELIWFAGAVNGGQPELCAELTAGILLKGEAWTSIGSVSEPYAGTFSGNGHRIEGLSAPLFDTIGSYGVVQELAVYNEELGSESGRWSECGMIAARNAGTIRQCSVRVSRGLYISGNFGMVVYDNKGTIEDCMANAVSGRSGGSSTTLNASGSAKAAGIAYLNGGGTIQSCYFHGGFRYNDAAQDYAITASVGGDVVENCYCRNNVLYLGKEYYLDESRSGITGVDLKALGSGEVTWLLNNDGNMDGSETEPWRQEKLTTGKYPSLDQSYGRVTRSADGTYSLDTPHTHMLDGKLVEFTKWTGTEGLPGDGYFYLENDVVLQQGAGTGRNTVLCLNGKQISAKPSGYAGFLLDVDTNMSLTILDDAANAGRITNTNSGINTGGDRTGILIQGGTLTLLGGNITGNKDGVKLAGGTLTLGGKVQITGNDRNIVHDDRASSPRTLRFLDTLDSGSVFGISTEKQADLADGARVTVTDASGAAHFNQLKADGFPEYELYLQDDGTVALGKLRAHTHCICGDGTMENEGHKTHTDVTFEPWNSATTLPTSGQYYLTRPVTLNGYWNPENVQLCLNGNSVTMEGRIAVNSGAEVQITDCGTTGGINSAKPEKVNAAHVMITKGSFALYGGTMNGLSFEIHQQGGTFNMFGGKITGNKCTAVDTQNGNNIAINLYGGEISGNAATVSGSENGGGVYVGSGATFVMYGGTIAENTAYGSGGGVYVANANTTYGKGTFTMRGGTITKNSAAVKGGGIYVSGTLSVSGNVNITENKDLYGASNIFMGTNVSTGVVKAPITISAALDPAARIGVRVENIQQLPAVVTVASAANAAWVIRENFVCDNGEEYPISLSDDGTMVQIRRHVHQLDENGYCADCGKTFSVQVTDAHGTVTYFETRVENSVDRALEDALKGTSGNGTVKILRSNVGVSGQVTEGRTVTLDPNGKTLPAAGGLNVNGTLILHGSGRVEARITLNGGTLRTADGWSGYVETVFASKSTDGSKMPAMQLGGGTYQLIAALGVQLTAGALLQEGRMFCSPDNSGTYVHYDTVITPGTPLMNMQVKLCDDHADADGDAVCDYCNAELVVKIEATNEQSSVTVQKYLTLASQSGNMDGYEDAVEMLDGQLSSVSGYKDRKMTLLRDVERTQLHLRGDFTLAGAGKTIDADVMVASGAEVTLNGGRYANIVVGGAATVKAGTIFNMRDGVMVAKGGVLTTEQNSVFQSPLTVDGRLVAEGGSFGAVTFRADSEGVLKDGTYSRLKIEGGKTLDTVLAADRAYCMDVSPYNTILNGAVTELDLGSNVRVIAHQEHSCGADGKCACGKTMAAALTAGGKTVGYETLKAAVDAANAQDGEKTLKLYQDWNGGAGASFNFQKGPVTLDLNGKQLGGITTLYVLQTTLTITGSGSVYSIVAGGAGSAVKISGGVTVDKISASPGGRLELGGGTYHLLYVQPSSTAVLTGGSYSEIYGSDKQGRYITPAEMLGAGYGYRDAGGSWVTPEALAAGSTLQNVTVAKAPIVVSGIAAGQTYTAAFSDTEAEPAVTVTPQGAASFTKTVIFRAYQGGGTTPVFTDTTDRKGQTAFSHKLGALYAGLDAGVYDDCYITVTYDGYTYQSGTFTVKVAQSKATLAVRTKNSGTTTDQFVYGDVISMELTLDATGVAAQTRRALRGGANAQLESNYFVILDEDGKELTARTAPEGTGKQLTQTLGISTTVMRTGMRTLTARYVGGSGTNMASVDQSFTVTIQPKATVPNVVISTPTGAYFFYDGSAKTPEVLVRAGSSTGPILKRDVDYTVEYANNVNATTSTSWAKLTVKAKTGGGYTFEPVEQQFNIGRRSLSDENVVASWIPADKLVYDGNGKDVLQALRYAGKELTKDTDYVVRFYDLDAAGMPELTDLPVNAGKYRVVVEGRGNFVSSIQQEFSIREAATTWLLPTVREGLRYNGTELVLLKSGAQMSDGTAEVQYSLQKDGPYAAALPTAKTPGTYQVWFKGEQQNYAVEPACVEVTIDKALLTPAGFTLEEKFYNGKTDATVKNVALDGAYETLTCGTDYTATAMFADANAGVQSATVTVALNDTAAAQYYELKTATITGNWEIKRADAAGTAPTAAAGLMYRGTAQALLTANGTTADGEMQYSLEKNGVYSTQFPTGTDARTYAVWYKVVGDRNHNDSQPASVPVVIAQRRVLITVLDQSTYQNTAAPSLNAPEEDKDFTVEGLIGNDALLSGPTLYYADAAGTEIVPDTSKLGKAAYIAARGGSVSENYVLAYQAGVLTVEMKPSGTSRVPAQKDGTDAADEELRFKDVQPDDYFYEPVQWAVESGVTRGISKTLFGPNDICTRAQVATFLWRAAGKPEAGSNAGLTDVAADAYCAKAVAWAMESGTATGLGGGKFGPELACTRAQVVTFLWRAAGSPEPKTMSRFTDVAADAYYAKAVAWAVENGITTGTGSGRFSPDAPCTRAQVVTFLFRAQKAR